MGKTRMDNCGIGNLGKRYIKRCFDLRVLHCSSQEIGGFGSTRFVTIKKTVQLANLYGFPLYVFLENYSPIAAETAADNRL